MNTTKISPNIFKLILNGRGGFNAPYGNYVEIDTSPGAPIYLHTIFDGSYVRSGFWGMTRRNPDYEKLVTFSEERAVGAELFGKGQKYATTNLGWFVPTPPSNSRPGILAPPQMGDVIWADSTIPHHVSCPKYHNPNSHEFGRNCHSCKQNQLHVWFRRYGWVVYNPPTRMGHDATLSRDRVDELMSTFDSMFFSPTEKEKNEKILTALMNGSATQNDIDALAKFFREMEQRHAYAEKVQRKLAEGFEQERSKLFQKGIDAYIVHAITNMANFAQMRGGRHVLTIWAKDFDFQKAIYDAIANSAWSDGSDTMHTEENPPNLRITSKKGSGPRLRILNINFGGVGAEMLTDAGIREDESSWYWRTLKRHLRGYTITKDDADSLVYSRSDSEFDDQRNAVNR